MTAALVRLATTPDARWKVVWLLAKDVPSATEAAPALAQLAERAEHTERADPLRWPVRLAAVAGSAQEASAALQQKLESHETAKVAPGGSPVFMFTGQGAQAVGMGRGLLVHPQFRLDLERWCAALSAPSDAPLLETIYGSDACDLRLANTWNAQRALFALEVSLATLWMRAGVRPGAVIGHSIGEIAAAWIARAMSAEAAVELVCTRARLMAELPEGGAMVAVRAAEDEVSPMLGDGVCIAAINGAKNTAISGPACHVRRAQEALEAAGAACQPLQVSHAFHSSAIDPMLEPFRRALERLTFEVPVLPLVSNVTGELLGSAPGPSYWADHARGCVRFAHGMQSLQQAGHRLFLEIGPSPVLKRLGVRSRAPNCTWLSTLEPPADDFHALLTAAVALFEGGAHVDWNVLTGGSA